MLGFTKGGVGYVIVKTTSLRDDKTGFKGTNGIDLVADTSFNPQRYARTYGEVVTLPVTMGSMPIYQEPPGFPGYGPIRRYINHDMEEAHPALYSTGRFGYKFMSDIEPELNIGDKVYFSWRMAYSPNNILAHDNNPDPSKREYLIKVPYNEVYCAIRDGEIFPIASYVFINPEMEQWEDVLTPTYYKDQVAPDGKPVPRPKDQWIQTKRFPENKDRIGTIEHIGTPIKGENRFFSRGDKVLYKVRLKNVREIEGKKFIIIPQRKILAKINTL